MTGGVALVVLGAWLITQVLFGHALERSGLIGAVTPS